MKKTCKQLSALLLALVMVLSLVPVSALAARVENDAVAVAAPDVATDAAQPAGAVNADVPAALSAEDGPEYTIANINAGYFDIGANVTGDATSGWQVTYTNTLDGSATDAVRNGSAVTATAASWVMVTKWNDGPAWVAVDGYTGGNNPSEYTYRQWHTAYTNYGDGQGSHQGTPNTLAEHFIDLKITEGAVNLGGLRYFGGKSSGASVVNQYQILKWTGEGTPDSSVTSDEGWTLVKTGNLANTWDAWQLITFDEPVNTQYIRFRALSSHNNNEHMTASEIRLVKAGEIPEYTISGTIREGETPLEGAKVELVQNNLAKTFVHSVQADTTNEDGEYSLVISTLAAGDYKLRVSKDGYGAIIGTETITIPSGGATASITGKDETIAAINKEGIKFEYDMTENSRPDLKRVSYNGDENKFVELDSNWTGDKMTLTFKAMQSDTGETKDTMRMNRLVTLLGTGVKNGVIEFDATREGSYTNGGRYGLALRLQNSSEWIFVGQWNEDAKWAREYWPGVGQTNVWTGATGYDGQVAFDVDGPSFTKGDTRHFKVTIDGVKLKLEIDGITVFDLQDMTGIRDGDGTPPSLAADVGFVCGNDTNYGVESIITIDNLYIFRDDLTHPLRAQGRNRQLHHVTVVYSSFWVNGGSKAPSH